MTGQGKDQLPGCIIVTNLVSLTRFVGPVWGYFAKGHGPLTTPLRSRQTASRPANDDAKNDMLRQPRTIVDHRGRSRTWRSCRRRWTRIERKIWNADRGSFTKRTDDGLPVH